jgi:hypothetical protein
MGKIRTFARRDGLYGLYRGKGKTALCLAYGSYEEIVPLGQAIKALRKARKEAQS